MSDLIHREGRAALAASAQADRRAARLSPVLAFLPAEGATRIGAFGRRAAGVGSAASVDGVPGAPAIDLLVLSPCVRRALDPRLRATLADAAARVGPDGVVYVTGTPLARWLVTGRLARRFPARDVLLVGDGGDGSHGLVPVAPGVAGRTALELGLGRGSPKRALVARVCATAAGRRLVGLLPNIGVAMRRAGAQPCCAWLGPAAAAPAAVTGMAVSAQGPGLRAVAIAYSGDGPVAVGKIAAGAGERLVRERDALDRLGDQARAAGARVPRAIAHRPLAHGTVLLESAVPGRPVADLLRAEPQRAWPVLDRLADWLGRWNLDTMTEAVVTRSRLDRWLLAPARELARDLPEAAAYLARLSALSDAVEGTRLPLVAAHHDLTMANVLWSDALGLAIVDWESATEEALPLTDLLYATADAVHRATGLSRAAAWRACFTPGGGHHGRARALVGRLPAPVRPTGALADVVLHATVLHHARNEARTTVAGPRPFLMILRQAAHRVPDDDGP